MAQVDEYAPQPTIPPLARELPPPERVRPERAKHRPLRVAPPAMTLSQRWPSNPSPVPRIGSEELLRGQGPKIFDTGRHSLFRRPRRRRINHAEDRNRYRLTVAARLSSPRMRRKTATPRRANSGTCRTWSAVHQVAIGAMVATMSSPGKIAASSLFVHSCPITEHQLKQPGRQATPRGRSDPRSDLRLARSSPPGSSRRRWLGVAALYGQEPPSACRRVRSRSRGLLRGGALADGERSPTKKGGHRFVALAIWPPDKTLAKTCAAFSDLEKLVRMVVSICSVTGPPRLRGSMISRQVAASQRSLMLGGSTIWIASRKVLHSPHRVMRLSSSTRASRAEISPARASGC
jgi:hypothetical protein